MGSDGKLFGVGKPKLWTIPPGTDFLKSFAETLANELDLKNKPDALADAIIYMPNQRSSRSLALALFDATGQTALLPPDIRTLGDLETEDMPPTAEAVLIKRPEAITSAERLGRLSRLVVQFYRTAYGIDLPPQSALAAAGELCRILDQAALSEQVEWDKLNEIGTESELAGHWQQSVRFLEIILDAWPKMLQEAGKIEPFVRRVQMANAMAAKWRAAPPDAPVIIAGSTGATPAGRILMKAVMELPKGLIVLPGLDTGADEKDWAAIRSEVSHPQNTLVDTLDALGRTPETIAIWPDIPEDLNTNARRRLVHEALAPAKETADWRGKLELLADDMGITPAELAKRGLNGMTVLPAPDEAAEAQAAALLLRQALEEGKSATMVTPDAGLARRVSALLLRWGVHVPPSAGQPLGRTAAGSLVGLCANWACDPADPVLLSAILRHPFVPRHEDTAMLEMNFLRGPRRWSSLTELRDNILTRHEVEPYHRYKTDDQERATAMVGYFIAMFDETGADFSNKEFVSGRDAIERIAALASAVSQAPLPWAGEDGQGAAKLFDYIGDVSDWLEGMAPEMLAELVNTQAAQATVSAGLFEHPKLSIRGPLEARLHTADRVVLAGLNEDVWPQRPTADAFLPRHFRQKIGLNDPEDRMGLSAHDFAQLACAPEVWMLYSHRRDNETAVASRWVWRLETLARGALSEAEAKRVLSPSDFDPMTWVEAIQARGEGDLPPDFSAEPRPTKRSPAHWPARLSVTRVDKLQRDPYALWAESVLNLDALDTMNRPLDPRERGTAIHKALEDLEAEGQEKSADALLDLLELELLRVGEKEADFEGRRAMWRRTCEWYMDWRAKRDTGGGRVKLERKGMISRVIAGDIFELSAVADRVETTSSGQLVIVDFKTGSPPTDSQIAVGLDQQMPLQALIAREGGYEGVPAAKVEKLEYVSFRAQPSSRYLGEKGDTLSSDPDVLASAALAGLDQLITEYRNADAIFLSAPRVQFVKYDSGFNLLARRAEWAGDIVEDGGSNG